MAFVTSSDCCIITSCSHLGHSDSVKDPFSCCCLLWIFEHIDFLHHLITASSQVIFHTEIISFTSINTLDLDFNILLLICCEVATVSTMGSQEPANSHLKGVPKW